jgi:hypothetical protein
VITGTFAVFWLAIPLFAAWAAMYSERAIIAPPAWLPMYTTRIVAGAAALVGAVASQFAGRLAKARYLKLRKQEEDD